MHSLVGLCGKDWVILAADSSLSHSIICVSESYDRIAEVDSRHLLSVEGETYDCVSLKELIQGRTAYYHYRNGVELTTEALAHSIRHCLADAIRKDPYKCNCFLAGYDGEKASLYYLDYLGSLQKVPYGSHGYHGYLVLSVFDKHYKPDMTLEQGMELMKMVLKQIRTRFVAGSHGFIVKVIDKDGIRKVDVENTQ